MKRTMRVRNLALLTIALLGVLALGTVRAQGDGNAGGTAGGVAALAPWAAGTAPFYAAAAVMGIACMSAAYAVGKVGAAALGAAAEKPELLGKSIVFVGLGEGIAIFGLIISLMILNKAG
jgi:V/A-type H+/Na+-transporting ATPase subunit K